MPSNKAARLPLGLQTFSEVRKLNCAYVDKTPLAIKLAESGKMYFLARPRRFGKSLFLDTLRNLFEGNQELFQGLYAETNWQWAVRFPVIKLDMSGTSSSLSTLSTMLAGKLRRAAERISVELPDSSEPHELFEQLIHKAHVEYGRKVVLLIDEYDKPMIDNIDEPDLARQMRKQLRNFYSIIKATDEHLRFVMLTGVSKFAKVSIFSGLNNLEDISLNAQYASICGYTEEDLNHTFGEHLQSVDREQLRRWYNGYNFLGKASVYNPYDILNFIKDSQYFGEFRFYSYWFETSTPTFIIDLLARDQIRAQNLEPQRADKDALNNSSLEHLELTAALFQSGYLTIDAVDSSTLYDGTYKLVCPNRSVRSALQNNLFKYYTGSNDASFKSNVVRALHSADLNTVESELKRLFSRIASDNYRKNNIAHFEGYYASVVYSFFAGMDCEAIAEDAGNHGRIDLTIQHANYTYVIEFKVVKRKSQANSALQQLLKQGYAAKYSGSVYQIGIEFSETKRNIVGFAWQLA